MPTPLDLRLSELSRIICTSTDAATIAAAAKEHRSLCREHMTMPVCAKDTEAANRSNQIAYVLDMIRQTYAETGLPVSISDITQAVGISPVHAGVYTRHLVETNHIITYRNKRHHVWAVPL